MAKRRYEILLPLTHNDFRPVSPDLFDQVRKELLTQFGGMHYQPNFVRGAWAHEGSQFEDELIRYVVDVEDTPENRQFFADYKIALRDRFEQIEVYIASYLVDIL
jgi:hypothetical protein